MTANQGKSWAATITANQADLPEFGDLMVIRKMKKKCFVFSHLQNPRENNKFNGLLGSINECYC